MHGTIDPGVDSHRKAAADKAWSMPLDDIGQHILPARNADDFDGERFRPSNLNKHRGSRLSTTA